MEKASAQTPAPGLRALAPLGDGRLAAVVRTGGEVQVWEAEVPRAETPLAPRRILLRVPAGSGTAALSIR